MRGSIRCGHEPDRTRVRVFARCAVLRHRLTFGVHCRRTRDGVGLDVVQFQCMDAASSREQRENIRRAAIRARFVPRAFRTLRRCGLALRSGTGKGVTGRPHPAVHQPTDPDQQLTFAADCGRAARLRWSGCGVVLLRCADISPLTEGNIRPAVIRARFVPRAFRTLRCRRVALRFGTGRARRGSH